MLKGKTAVVTGGSRGIGAAIAEKFASLGADLAVLYAGSAEAAADVCSRCSTCYGVKTKAYCCNVSDFAQTKATVAEIKAEFGTIHILVNNAGITRAGLIAIMRIDSMPRLTPTSGRTNMIPALQPDSDPQPRRKNHQHQLGRRDHRQRRTDELFRVEGGTDRPVEGGCAGTGGKEYYLQCDRARLYPDRHDKGL
jgi:hypothetical protein